MNLGESMMTAGFAFTPAPDEGEAILLVRAIISALNLSPAPGEVVWRYPLPGTGAGGVGFTFVQPITESFIVMDAWPHNKGAYLFIGSCVPFLIEKVFNVLMDNYYNVLQCYTHSLLLVE